MGATYSSPTSRDMSAAGAAVTDGQLTTDKLAQLEEELSKLRTMIASVVIKQEGECLASSKVSHVVE